MKSKHNRHPKRTWFGDTPVRTLADAEADRHHESRDIARENLIKLRTLDAAAQCERQAKALFADRLLQPEQVRAKHPGGWLTAPYVRCLRLAAVPVLARVGADGVPVLLEVVR